MSLPRIALSLILTLALAAAPVLPALAMAGSSAPQTAGLHAGHATQIDAAAAAGHDRHKTCAQHDYCNGTCCASCAQSVAGVMSFRLQSDVIRPVLTPLVHHLSFSYLFSLRDRPPRLLSI